MKELLITTLILFVTTGLPCIILAYLIGVKQRTDLLASWYEPNCLDVKAFTRLAALGMLILGVGPSIVFIIWSMNIISTIGAIISLVGLIMFPIVIGYYAQLKYMK